MTREECDRINRERLLEFRRDLRRESATALVCIGVGHGSRSGMVHVCIPEGVDVARDLIPLLEQCAAIMRAQLRAGDN